MNRHRNLLIILFLAGLIFIFFSRLLLTDFIFYYKDFFRYFYPTKYFASHCLREGIIPLWNPYNFCGMPFLASLQSQVLYPFSFIVYFLPINLGLKLFIVMHLFWAGIFTYLLMQEWRISKTSSLISSIIYIFSGYFISVADILNVLVAITWIPFIFLFFVKALTILKTQYIILTGIGLCLQFLGGEPTTLYATLLVLILYTFSKVIRLNISHSLKIMLIILSIGLTGLGLNSFQLLPFLELVFHSNRALGMSFEQAVRWSLAPHELLDLLIPLSSFTMTAVGKFPYVQGLIDSIYLGIISLCLIFIGIGYRWLGLFWTLVFFCFILLSLGEHFILYKWLYTYIPGFNLMQIPVKFFSIVTFAGALLAGFGYEHLKSGKIRPFLIVSIAIFIGLLLIQIKFPLQHFKIEIILLILVSLLILLARKGVISLNFLSVWIVCFILIDLFIAGADLNPMVKESFYQQESRLAKLIEKEDEYCRILLSPKSSRFFYYHSGPIETNLLLEAHEAMLSNLGLLHENVFDADGYECIFLKDYYTLMRIIATGKLTQVTQLLNLLNIKYIISREKLGGSELKLIEDKKVKIYKNPTCFSRAFLVPQAIVIKDRNEILRKMLNRDFDPQKEVILEEKIPNKSQIPNFKSQIQIIDYQPNKVIINTSSPTNCILFLSDTYYPGWKAFVDGKVTKIYRANYTFRAIPLPKGRHKVEFNYSPVSFKIGMLISLLTISFIITVQVVKNFAVYQVKGSRFKVTKR
ncbi:MAG: YfhO family protein [bacterium]